MKQTSHISCFVLALSGAVIAQAPASLAAPLAGMDSVGNASAGSLSGSHVWLQDPRDLSDHESASRFGRVVINRGTGVLGESSVRAGSRVAEPLRDALQGPHFGLTVGIEPVGLPVYDALPVPGLDGLPIPGLRSGEQPSLPGLPEHDESGQRPLPGLPM